MRFDFLERRYPKARPLVELLRRLDLRFWLSFAVAVAIASAAEHGFQHYLEAREAARELPSTSLMVASGLYQRLLTSQRKPVIRYTSTVEINADEDSPSVSASDVCNERGHLADLLTQIDAARPAMIVVDKHFGRDVCKPGDPNTAKLLATIARIRADRPLIVGLSGVAQRDPDRAAHDGRVIVPSLAFDGPDRDASAGIDNVAEDNRRLPLQWQMFATAADAAAGRYVVRDTLALVAARRYNPYLLHRSPLLAALIADGEKPFIGFIDPEEFKPSHFYASDVMCGPARERQTWPDCPTAPPPQRLQNQIVLVGEAGGGQDVHTTVFGRQPGYYLQANYLEALLDDRYYAPGGWLLDTLFGLVFLVLLEASLLFFEEKPVVGVALVGGLVAATYAVLYGVLALWGVYIDPALVTITVLVLNVSHFLLGRVAHGRKKAGSSHEEKP